MKILLIGNGGREHALAEKLLLSPLCDQLYVANGNAGIGLIAQLLQIPTDDFEAVKTVILANGIDMVVVGPEVPLVAGITDFINGDPALAHVMVIGPGKIGSQLEGSKAFAKAFMQRHSIPTASFATFHTHEKQLALDYLQQHPLPVVLKADGLAAGKGVLICQTREEAILETEHIFSGKFGKAGETLVIESFLDGIEFSAFVLTDGDHYVMLPEAKDYKRIGEGDTGLNTGGMGAVSPVPFVNETLWNKVITRIIDPTIQGIKSEQISYRGFIFFGLIVVDNDPYVIEYNCRLGDPETEVILPRLKTDLVELFIHTTKGTLRDQKTEVDPRYAVTIMLVSGGYPGSYENGKIIYGLDHVDNSRVYHAGTKRSEDSIVTAGGRVLAITSLASQLERAVEKSLINARTIEFEGKYYRSDIGKDLMKFLPQG